MVRRNHLAVRPRCRLRSRLNSVDDGRAHVLAVICVEHRQVSLGARPIWALWRIAARALHGYSQPALTLGGGERVL